MLEQNSPPAPSTGAFAALMPHIGRVRVAVQNTAWLNDPEAWVSTIEEVASAMRAILQTTEVTA